jgi:membrane-bound lytic murein transglycosylase D
MNPYWAGILLLCGLLVGCGGGQAHLAKLEAPPPAAVAPEPVDLGGEEEDDSLMEQLSAERLEELYARSGIPGWDPGIESELQKWDQKLGIDMPIHINRQVKAYLVYFSTERKQVITRFLARSSRYLPMIREIFQEHGLPEDMAYLALVESGYNPHAYSHASASGMWQFIRGTGLRYGLAINDYVDERRDPEKSTHAAAKYLLDLYKRFGSWYLAAASYNCGEGRVQRELNNSDHKNFWELAANQRLPNETQNYVPQMIAAILIAKNPERFGFQGVPYLPPLQYEKVRVDQPTSLTAAAVACNLSPEEMRMLNPELRRGLTPPGASYYTLKIPKGASQAFAQNIMMARVEHPAQISTASRQAPRASARRTASRSSARRSTASRQASASAPRRTSPTRAQTVGARNPGNKKVQTASVQRSKTVQSAKVQRGASVQTAGARQSQKVQSAASAPVMASMLATPKGANKNQAAKAKRPAKVTSAPAKAPARAQGSKKTAATSTKSGTILVSKVK